MVSSWPCATGGAGEAGDDAVSLTVDGKEGSCADPNV
jgi:hypothetical protein